MALASPALHCTHRPPCPGCPRFLAQLDEHPALPRLRVLAAETGARLRLEPSAEPRGYRVRARLAVRGRLGSPKLGIFQAGSHRIVDIPGCVVHHPAINDAAAVVKHAMRDLRVEPYADAPHRGLVRYVQIAVERASRRVQLVVVGNCSERAPLEALLARIQSLLGERLHGLFFSLNDLRNNAILGPRCEKFSGADAIVERIASADVFFPPDAFGQSHLALYERIVERIVSGVPEHADVLELYAGTGAIGLAAIARSRRVRFNELGRGSLTGLQMGIDALAPELRARAEVVPGDALELAGSIAGAEVVIADPPRRGLDPSLVAALAAAPPGRFFYVSCGFESFMNDARTLLASGHAQLRELSVFDLFPFTEHVELLAMFARSDAEDSVEAAPHPA